MLKLELLILLSIYGNFNTAFVFFSLSPKSVLIPNEGRDKGGWGCDNTLGTILSLLTLGAVLFNLLWNFNDTTGTGTGTGTTTGTGTGTARGTTGFSGRKAVTSGGVTTTRRGNWVGRTRVKIPTVGLKPLGAVNIMGKELVDMIEGVLTLDEECLPNLLCVTNHRAAVAGNGFQYLTPLCSLGVFYYREKLRLRENIKRYIIAIRDGVTEQNCSAKHPGCD